MHIITGAMIVNECVKYNETASAIISCSSNTISGKRYNGLECTGTSSRDDTVAEEGCDDNNQYVEIVKCEACTQKTYLIFTAILLTLYFVL